MAPTKSSRKSAPAAKQRSAPIAQRAGGGNGSGASAGPSKAHMAQLQKVQTAYAALGKQLGPILQGGNLTSAKSTSKAPSAAKPGASAAPA